MASKSCITCLRTLQRQPRIISRKRTKTTQTFATTRTFATTSRNRAELPGPYGTASTAIPAIKPGKDPKANPDQAIPLKLAERASLENRKVRGLTETYTAYGATEVLYKECAKQAEYTIPQAADPNAETPKTDDGEDLGVGGGWWHDDLGLKPTFSTWSQVTMLHIYILSTRFRYFEPDVCKIWQQHLLDHFFYDMEEKMVIHHGMNARGTRNKYLKDIFVQWRGVLAAYDEGMAKNDAVLAGAIWRNIFKASGDVDIKKLAQIVSFTRKSLASLDSVDDLKVMQARMQFGSPATEEAIVTKKTALLDQSPEQVKRAVAGKK